MFTIYPADDALSSELLQEIGRVTIRFNLLEECLENLIMMLTCNSTFKHCSNEHEVFLLCRRMGVQEKVGCIRDLIHHHAAKCTEDDQHAAAIEGFNRVMDRVGALSGRRNVLIHGLWDFDPTPAGFDITAYRKRGQGGAFDVDVASLNRLSQEASEVCQQVWAAFIKVGECILGWGVHRCQT